MIIRQCIPTDRETAMAFLQAALKDPAGFDATNMDHRLSLIASENDATLGVAVCQAGYAPGERILSVAASDPQMMRTLIDKATIKLHAHGVHKFKIALHGVDGAGSLWETTRWTAGLPEPAPAPAAKAPAKKKKAKATPAAPAPSAS